jgi:hypothetical protein
MMDESTALQDLSFTTAYQGSSEKMQKASKTKKAGLVQRRFALAHTPPAHHLLFTAS